MEGEFHETVVDGATGSSMPVEDFFTPQGYRAWARQWHERNPGKTRKHYMMIFNGKTEFGKGHRAMMELSRTHGADVTYMIERKRVFANKAGQVLGLNPDGSTPEEHTRKRPTTSRSGAKTSVEQLKTEGWEELEPVGPNAEVVAEWETAGVNVMHCDLNTIFAHMGSNGPYYESGFWADDVSSVAAELETEWKHRNEIWKSRVTTNKKGPVDYIILDATFRRNLGAFDWPLAVPLLKAQIPMLVWAGNDPITHDEQPFLWNPYSPVSIRKYLQPLTISKSGLQYYPYPFLIVKPSGYSQPRYTKAVPALGGGAYQHLHGDGPGTSSPALHPTSGQCVFFDSHEREHRDGSAGSWNFEHRRGVVTAEASPPPSMELREDIEKSVAKWRAQWTAAGSELILYLAMGSAIDVTWQRKAVEALIDAVLSSGKKVFLLMKLPHIEGPDPKASKREIERKYEHARGVVFADFFPQQSLFWKLGLNADVHDPPFVFLTHGGMGSVAEAIAGNVPMICLPMTGDQPMNSRSVADAGVAVTLSEIGVAEDGKIRLARVREITPKLHSAITEVVAEYPTVRRKLTEVRKKNQEDTIDESKLANCLVEIFEKKMYFPGGLTEAEVEDVFPSVQGRTTEEASWCAARWFPEPEWRQLAEGLFEHVSSSKKTGWRSRLMNCIKWL